MIRELLERIDRIDLSILETVVIGRLRIYRGTVKSPFVVLLVLNVIWGLNPVAIRRVGFELSPVNLTLARWLIASAGLLLIAPFLFRRRRFSFKKRDITALVIVSLANVAAYHLAINYAETIVSSSVAGLLLSFGPVFAVVLSTIYLKETVALTQYVALIVAILGTIALFAPDFGFTFSNVAGPMAVIFSSFMFSVFSVGSKPLVEKFGSLPTNILVGLLGTTFLLPLLSLAFFTQLLTLSVVGWLALLYMGIPGTILSYALLYVLFKTRTVSSVSIQLYIAPIISVVGGVLLLHETFSVFTVVGGLLLLAAVGLSMRGGT